MSGGRSGVDLRIFLYPSRMDSSRRVLAAHRVLCAPLMAASSTGDSTSRGKVSCSMEAETFTFTWTVDNFRQHCEKQIKSPVFSIGYNNATEWKFIVDTTDLVYPRSTNVFLQHNVRPSKAISLFLEMLSGNPFGGDLYFSYVDGKGASVGFPCITNDKFECGKTYGHSHFIDFYKLIDPGQGILPPSGTLTVRCTLIYKNSEIIARNTQLNTSFGTESLVGSEKFSDVEIIARGCKIPAHKVILCTRSQHFANMFEHDTLEKQTNRVELDMDEETAREFLRYLYTGCTSLLSLEGAEALFVAADKYLLDELKSMCAKSILQRLSVENAFRILVLADTHDHADLKVASLNLIANNAETMTRGSEWNECVKTHPHLSSDVIQVIMNNPKSNRCKQCGYICK